MLNFPPCHKAILWFSVLFFFFLLPCTVCTTPLNNGSLNFYNREDCQALTQYIFARNSYSGKYTQWEIRFGRSFNSRPLGIFNFASAFFSLSHFYLFIFSSKAHISPQRLCSAAQIWPFPSNICRHLKQNKTRKRQISFYELHPDQFSDLVL